MMRLIRIFTIALAALSLVAVAGCGDETKCPSGQNMCGNECVNLNNNDDHCGACDSPCGAYANCSNMSCVCISGYTNCGDSCTNMQWDSANCGACDNACDTGYVCVLGQCRTEVT